jgi:hypothetical protein
LSVTITKWLEMAKLESDARGLASLHPLLEGLARQTAVLRAADWNLDARAGLRNPSVPDAR